ncbi:hypothetical protein CFAM422_001387 [Trichoderma lentiforme]|uniref:Uncharacterized protein n=1 Tax=Trichoderma lentiforme TaxID=1567552 RepID=A0A9P5CGA7_9HYPO|nr:hypothetical protein CFAM422_001387 [Trichoderma lentiforme]
MFHSPSSPWPCLDPKLHTMVKLGLDVDLRLDVGLRLDIHPYHIRQLLHAPCQSVVSLPKLFKNDATLILKASTAVSVLLQLVNKDP